MRMLNLDEATEKLLRDLCKAWGCSPNDVVIRALAQAWSLHESSIPRGSQDRK